MRIFLYEWVTGGGLVEQSGRLPESMLAEGSAMISAAAADFAALDGCEVTVLRDIRLEEPALPNCRVVEVHSTPHWRQEFDRCVAAADLTLVIAPETDSILGRTVERVREAGSRAFNASDKFIAVASCKAETVRLLHAAGVPAPHGRLVEADAERLPADFDYPAVLKPLDGAGSQHTFRVEGPRDEPEPYPWPRRLERFHAGRAASAAFLCGPAGRFALPPCWQRLANDDRFTYLGGATIQDPHLASRAVQLAERALNALPPAHAYVGVDMVLGDADDGSQDVAIEINPRLTTSYVGLRKAIEGNLAQAMIDVDRGVEPGSLALVEPIEFSATGQTRAAARATQGSWS